MYPTTLSINSFLQRVDDYSFTVEGSRFTNSLLVSFYSNLEALSRDTTFTALRSMTTKYIDTIMAEPTDVRRYLRLKDFFSFFAQDIVSGIVYAYEEETWKYLSGFYDFIIRLEGQANEGKAIAAALLADFVVAHFCDVHPFSYDVDDGDVDY